MASNSFFETKNEVNERQLAQLQYHVMQVVQCGSTSLLDLVKKRYPEFDFNFEFYNKHKSFTPLLYACKCNRTDIVKWLLDELPDNSKNSKTELRETALILACKNNDVKMDLITELLSKGNQHLGSRDKHKLTALHIACYKGLSELAERLLRLNNTWISKGLRPPKTIDKKQLRDMNGNTPFMMAVQYKHQEIVEMWLKLEKEPSMILRPVCEDKNKKGHNAVMMAIQSGQLACLEEMAKCNAISDEIGKSVTKCGWNVFHCAAASGHLDILEWLLSWNGNALMIRELLDASTEKGYTPFLMACEYHHLKIVEHFIKIEEEADESLISIDENIKTGMMGLHLAAKHDAVEIVDLILQNVDIDDVVFKTDEEGNTVLHTATMKSSTKVEESLKRNLSVDDYEKLQAVKNKEGFTAEDVLDPIHIPLEIRKRGQASIDAYRTALSKGKTRNNQCNLIVLGEARVGKTSLIRSILNVEFDPECKSTRGVLLEEPEFAENVDIIVPLDSQQGEEVWRQVTPLKRVGDRIADTVAQAVNEVAPVNQQKVQETSEIYFNNMSEIELKRHIQSVLKKLFPPVKKPAAEKPRDNGSLPPPSKMDRQKSIDGSSTSSFQTPVTSTSKPPPASSSAASSVTPTEVNTAPSKKKVDPEAPPPAKQPTKSQKSAKESASSPLEGTDSASKASRSFRRESSHTYADSIEIRKKLKNFKKKQPNQDLTFHTMDFAGQTLYRPMHHCFITNRAIYLVVFRLTEVLKHIQSSSNGTKDPINEIRYWLNNIIAHGNGPEESDDKTECPRIFLVGTFKDGDSKTDPIVPPLSDEDLKIINDRLMEVLVMKEKRYECSIQLSGKKKVIFCLENSISECDRAKSGIIPLMTKIRSLRDKIPFLAEDFPTSYLQFEKKLLKMKEERKDKPMITTREEVEGWAREAGIDDEGIDTAIQFFHDVRVIVDQTLISSPFKGRSSPYFNSSIVLLSPQCLATVMTAVVELVDGASNDEDLVSLSVMKNVYNYGIIQHEDLVKYLLSKLNLQANNPASAFANVLQILESYCLVYKLSDLHHKLLGLSSSKLKREYYLIPMMLPSYTEEQDKLCLPCNGYKFEFNFQSYLPTEIYIHTICFFLSTLKSLDVQTATNVAECVILTSCCSKFMFVQLDKLPKAHWRIQLDEKLHTLRFEILPLPGEVIDYPSEFIVAVNDRILKNVCVNGSLGYFKYTGGVRDTCSKTGNEVLLPFIIFDSQSSAANSLRPCGVLDSPYCPDCNFETKNINEILSKMLQQDTSSLYSAGSDITVHAASIDPVEIYRKYRADLIQLLSSSSIQLANELYSNGLVEHIAIDDASIQELSGYKKATNVFNCFDDFLNASENKKLVLSKFCDVLQGYTTSRELISRMRQDLRNCREHELPSVSAVLPKPHESIKSQQKSIATSTTVPITTVATHSMDLCTSKPQLDECETMIDVFSKPDISRGCDYNKKIFSFTGSDNKCQSFYWIEFGFEIHIPPGAVECDQEVTIHVEAAASLLKNKLKIPDDYYLVSDLFNITCDKEFKKGVSVCFNHAAYIESKEDIGIFKAETLEDEFEELSTSTVSGSQYVGGKVDSFSFFGIFQRSPKKIDLLCIVQSKPIVDPRNNHECNAFELIFNISKNCNAAPEFSEPSLDQFRIYGFTEKTITFVQDDHENASAGDFSITSVHNGKLPIRNILKSPLQMLVCSRYRIEFKSTSNVFKKKFICKEDNNEFYEAYIPLASMNHAGLEMPPKFKAGEDQHKQDPILVILITNTYEVQTLELWEDLPGVAKDREKLMDIFSCVLRNFELEDLQNLSLVDLKTAVSNKLSDSNNQKYGGLIVVFSGHGGKRPCNHTTNIPSRNCSISLDNEHSLIVANDGEVLHLSDCTLERGCIHEWADQFDKSVGKQGLPKYILLDCCRKTARSLKFHNELPLKGQRDLNITIAYATQDDKVIACPAEGSLWTTELCKELNAIDVDKENQTLLNILKMVRDKMRHNQEPVIDETHSSRKVPLYVYKK